MTWLLVCVFLLGQFSMVAQGTTPYTYELPDINDVAEVYAPAPADETAAPEEDGYLAPVDTYPAPEDTPDLDVAPPIDTVPAVPTGYLGIMPFAVSPIPLDYEIVPGDENEVDWAPGWLVDGRTEPLREGEIWTNKSVYYPQSSPGVYDGTAVVTIYIWGRQFERSPGVYALLGANDIVTVTTNIGDFSLNPGDYGSGLWTDGDPINPLIGFTPGGAGRISWDIPESLIIDGDAPLRIWYHLHLADRSPLNPPDWRSNFWYSTSGEHFEVRFEPAFDNPIYWTTREVTLEEDSFSGTINWNNGNGLKSAVITDNILGLTINFGQNATTPQGQLVINAPYATHPQYWIQNATVRGVSPDYFWHLQWESGGARNYILTVHNLAPDPSGLPGDLMDVSYVIYLPSGGGNDMTVSRREVTRTTTFRRSYDDDTHEPFEWDDEGRLIFRTPLIAQIMLLEDPETVVFGDLRVGKRMQSMYEDQHWYFLTENWFFTARLKVDDLYVTFELVAGNLVFAGFVDSATPETEIRFSDATPSFLITGLPRYPSSSSSSSPHNYVLYEYFTFETLDLITVFYSIDRPNFMVPEEFNPFAPLNFTYIPEDSGTFPTSAFEVEEDVTRTVEFLNVYDHGIGFLEVHKMLDGFPADFGINNFTEFYVRIFDLEAQNYLLFWPEELQSGRPALPSIPANPAFDYSYWCVGNHELGLTNFYDFSVVGFPVLELPVSVAQSLRTSNLWTGIAYEVREVRRVDDSPAGIAAANLAWETFWNSLAPDQLLPHWHDDFAGWPTWIETDWIGDPEDGSDFWILVCEIEPTDVGDSMWHEDKEWNWGVIYNAANNPTPLLRFNLPSVVTLTNRYKFHGGELEFVKELCDNALAWGVTDDTIFYAQIYKDDGRLVVFVPDPMTQTIGQELTWRVIGFIDQDLFETVYATVSLTESSAVALEAAYIAAYQVLCPVGAPRPPARARTAIPFTAAAPHARIIEVPVHPFTNPLTPFVPIDIDYTIVEVFPVTRPVITLFPDLGPTPPGDPPTGWISETITVVDPADNVLDNVNGFRMIDDEEIVVTILNAFEPVDGRLIIVKELDEDGFHDVWGVDGTTIFYAQVFKDGDTEPLVFVLNDDGVFVWEDTTSLIYTFPPLGERLTEIPFSAANAAVLVGLQAYFTSVDIARFEVVEVDSAGVPFPRNDPSIGFTWDDEIVYEDLNLFATITNTFVEAFLVFYDGNGGETGGGETGGGETTVPDQDNPYMFGDTVTVRANMFTRPGWNFAGWRRSDTNQLLQPGATFTMPNADITLIAQWTQGGGGGPITPPQPPQPPPPGGWFVEEHIWYVRGNARRPVVTASADSVKPLIEVQSPHDFEMRPDHNITRAEVAIVFYRLLRPEFKDFEPEPNPFLDVRGDEWYGLAVGILAYWEIIDGHRGFFRPNEPITRGELAAIVSRFDDLLETDANPYSDVTSSDWAYRYILSATERGWFIGFPDGTFRSRSYLTRAEFVTAVNRVLERGILLEHIPDDVLEFVDLDGTHWAHADFMEAAHSHDWEPHPHGIERWLAITGHGIDEVYNR